MKNVVSMSKVPKSGIQSTFDMTCPRCRKGGLFETGTFAFQKPFDMPDHCPVCKQNYLPEPGFYYGAMFISYIMWGFISLALCLTLVFAFDWSVNGAFLLLIIISAIFFVWLYRISRSIWIHLNVKYNPKVTTTKPVQ